MTWMVVVTDHMKQLALAYPFVTGVLVAVILASGWCWSFQNAHGLTNMALRDRCLYVWTPAIVALGLSQLVFIILANRAERGAVRTVILVVANAILLALVLLGGVLAEMPS